MRPEILRHGSGDRQAAIIFEDRKFSDKCWTHSLVDLVKLANLEAQLKLASAGNRRFEYNWLVAKDWSDRDRYKTTTHHLAKRLFAAITHDKNGVMPWIRDHW